jgi:aconitate hydratase
VVAGDNYGQGSSREHAVIGPRYLGLRVVIAKSFARIHLQNLCNFGVLPLTFVRAEDWSRIDPEDLLEIPDARSAVKKGNRVKIINQSKSETYETENAMSDRQLERVLEGSLINVMRRKHGT